MARTLNPKISAELRDKMVDFFSEDCLYRERIARSMLGTPELTFEELRQCVKDADDATLKEYGFRIQDLFVK